MKKILTIGIYADNVELNKKMCLKDNNGIACFRVGQMYHAGINGLTRDRKQSAKYYRLGCKQNHGKSCGLLGLFYSVGEGIVQKSDKKAIEYYNKGCDLKDDFSCYSLARYYEEGKVVKQDKSKAAFLHGQHILSLPVLPYRDQS